MTCPHCQRENRSGARFCAHCGQRMSSDDYGTVTISSPPPAPPHSPAMQSGDSPRIQQPPQQDERTQSTGVELFSSLSHFLRSGLQGLRGERLAGRVIEGRVVSPVQSAEETCVLDSAAVAVMAAQILALVMCCGDQRAGLVVGITVMVIAALAAGNGVTGAVVHLFPWGRLPAAVRGAPSRIQVTRFSVESGDGVAHGIVLKGSIRGRLPATGESVRVAVTQNGDEAWQVTSAPSAGRRAEVLCRLADRTPLLRLLVWLGLMVALVNLIRLVLA